MIADPDRWAPQFAEAGAGSVTFHVEAAAAPVRLARALRSAGARAGMALKPATPVEPYADLLPELDMLLLMTVEPGFGGQKFLDVVAAEDPPGPGPAPRPPTPRCGCRSTAGWTRTRSRRSPRPGRTSSWPARPCTAPPTRRPPSTVCARSRVAPSHHDHTHRGHRGRGPGSGGHQDVSTILVVDDDVDIARFIEINLRLEGFDVRVAHDGEAARAEIDARLPDLVLLDVMMPRIDGVELCRRLRADPATSGLPVIMLTAKSLSADKVVGLTAGRGRLHHQAVRHPRARRAGALHAAAQRRDAGRLAAHRPARQPPHQQPHRGLRHRRAARWPSATSTSTTSRPSTTPTGSCAATR